MAATIISRFTYPNSDFTSLGGNPINNAVLAQEIEDDVTITLAVGAIVSAGTDTQIELEGNATAAMKTALDSIVANHTGGNFSTFPKKANDDTEESDDTGNPVQKVSLSTGLMPGGEYLLTWYMELKLTSDGGTVTAARAHANLSKNGAAAVEQAQTNTPQAEWLAFSGSHVAVVVDGDELDLELTYERVGTSGNAARVQRGRLTITRIG
jgi:hypothetical protein